jgi:hypothetical protein
MGVLLISDMQIQDFDFFWCFKKYVYIDWLVFNVNFSNISAISWHLCVHV